MRWFLRVVSILSLSLLAACQAADVNIGILKSLSELVNISEVPAVNSDNLSGVTVSGACRDGSSFVTLVSSQQSGGSFVEDRVEAPCVGGEYSQTLNFSSFTDGGIALSVVSEKGAEKSYTLQKDTIVPIISGDSNIPKIGIGASRDFYFSVDEGVSISNLSALNIINGGGTAVSACGILAVDIVSATAGASQVKATLGNCSIEGDFSLVASSGLVSDYAGNTSAASGVLADFSVDLTAPVLGFISSASSVVGGPVSIELSFSEPVLSFDHTDFVYTNAEGSLRETSGTYYLDVIPLSAGTFSVAPASGAISDEAGNFLAVPFAFFSRDYDATLPIGTLSLVSAIRNGDGRYEVRVNFNKPVATISAGDFSCTSCSVFSLTQNSSSDYIAVINPSVSLGTLQLSLARAAIEDQFARTAETDAELSWVHDTISPATTLTLTSESQSNDGFDFTISFNESVEGFLTSSLGWDGSFSTVLQSGDNYSFRFTPSNQGSVSLSVPAGIVTDIYNNQNSSSGTVTIGYDSLAPEVQSFAPEGGGSWTNASSVDFRIIFDEAVETLSISDFQLTGSGSITNVSVVGGTGEREWLVTVETQADTSEDLNLNLLANAARDLSGNILSSPFGSLAKSVDRLAPQVTGTITRVGGEYVSAPETPAYSWGGASDGYGVGGVSGFFAIGTTAGGIDVYSWAALGDLSSLSAQSFSATIGARYYLTLKFQDALYNISHYDAGSFIYLAPPSVTGIENSNLVVGRQSPVIIYGNNFRRVLDVKAGGRSCSSFKELSPTALICELSGTNVGGDSLFVEVTTEAGLHSQDVIASWISDPCSGGTIGSSCGGTGTYYLGGYRTDGEPRANYKYMLNENCDSNVLPCAVSSAQAHAWRSYSPEDIPQIANRTTGGVNSPSFVEQAYGDELSYWLVQNSFTNAAMYCNGLTAGGYTDWYLPSAAEWKAISILSNSQIANVGVIADAPYWTSSEVDAANALGYNFGVSVKTAVSASKSASNLVRCIRRY